MFMAKLVTSLQKLGFKIRNDDARTLATRYDLSNKQSRSKVVHVAIADFDDFNSDDKDFIDSFLDMPLPDHSDF